MNEDPGPWTVHEIADLSDPAIEAFARLTDVELRQRVEPEQGIFIAEGHLVIERAVHSGLTVQAVLTSSRWLERLGTILGDWTGPVYVMSEEALEELTGFRVHRGALAAVRRPPELSVADLCARSGPVVVLEDLVDANNVGLAFRSAGAMGIGGIVLSPRCADPLYRRSVKGSMGAVLSVPWARSTDWVADLDLLAQERLLVALTPSAQDELHVVLGQGHGDAVALLLGSEGPGLSPMALTAAHARARIAMHGGIDSLNVAAATAVACYALDMLRRSR